MIGVFGLPHFSGKVNFTGEGLTGSPLLKRTGFSRSQMLLRINSSSCSNKGTFLRRSMQRWRLMSRRRPSGRSPTSASSSIPRVAAQRWRSCCRTRSRSFDGSCLRRIHHSRSRFRICISAFLAVMDCKNTCNKINGIEHSNELNTILCGKF